MSSVISRDPEGRVLRLL